MILGKIMMVQSASKLGSVEYQISKYALKIGMEIKNYTLEQFIKETGVSKTSLMRYLNYLGVNTFTTFKDVVASECAKGVTALEKLKDVVSLQDLSSDAIALGKIISKANRVIIVGDGNCFGLMVYKKALMHLGVNVEIPVYLGNEEDLFKAYALDQDDLVILISLHETFTSFLNNRTIFYRDEKYLKFTTPSKVAFIGEVDTRQKMLSDCQFAIDIEGAIYQRKALLDKLFEEAICYLALGYEFIY